MSEEEQPSRVLVTGGSGFLGTHIVRKLLEDPAISIAVVSRTPKKQFLVGSDKVSYHSVDIASADEVQALFDKVHPQVVIHTASPKNTDTAAALERTNVEGTKILLQSAKMCADTRGFVYTSSDSAIVPTQEPLTEELAELYTDTHFPNAYARSKALADALVQKANSDELRTAVIRVPVLYGEHDTSFIGQLISSVRKGEHKMQIGQNKKVFEFAYAPKAAEAHVLVARALFNEMTAQGVAGEAFFISDGRPELFFDFARRCYAAAGKPVSPEEVSAIPLAAMQAVASTGEWAYTIFTLGNKKPTLRRDNIDHLDRGCCWSVEKAKQRLGYIPVIDQDTAIQSSMKWALDNL
ncbi:NAD(P)-binding protein [Lophiostoma macrostomum CBS 122681]|uniref:NAD(P)-binding protein n=1 Tax=Lophiostoma macrostomum CBS 122681 TaxID=1314788 RepID=A0A6A6SNW4_9PLEO|nr:NAD(P)-binding protein [Lophiostoma macrostomum CBS 122681]